MAYERASAADTAVVGAMDIGAGGGGYCCTADPEAAGIGDSFGTWLRSPIRGIGGA
jgi:hypothetical protein